MSTNVNTAADINKMKTRNALNVTCWPISLGQIMEWFKICKFSDKNENNRKMNYWKLSFICGSFIVKPHVKCTYRKFLCSRKCVKMTILVSYLHCAFVILNIILDILLIHSCTRLKTKSCTLKLSSALHVHFCSFH